MPSTKQVIDARYELFFAALARCGQPGRACIESGVDRTTIYKRRRAEPEFAERWEAALEEFVDTLEREATRRAVEGTEKGVWHQGTQVGAERQFSDSLLLAMLKAKRREYRDTSKVELTGADGGPVQVEESPIALARKVAFVLALGLRATKAGAPTDDGSDLV